MRIKSRLIREYIAFRICRACGYKRHKETGITEKIEELIYSLRGHFPERLNLFEKYFALFDKRKWHIWR